MKLSASPDETAGSWSRVLLLAVLWAVSGQAAEPDAGRAGLALSWQAPPCARRPQLAELSGAATVIIAPVEDRWRLSVAFLAPVQGTRVLETGTCEEAADAAALFLRLGAGDAQAEPLVAPPLTAAEPQPPSGTLEATRLVLGASAGVQAVSTPQVTSRFGLDASYGTARWDLRLGVGSGPTTSAAGGPTTQAAVEVAAFLELALGGCVGHEWSNEVRLAGCLELDLAWWRLRGLAVSDPKTQDAAYLSLGPAARLRVPFWRSLALTAGLTARPTIVKPQASFEGYGIAFTAGPVQLQAELGVAMVLR